MGSLSVLVLGVVGVVGIIAMVAICVPAIVYGRHAEVTQDPRGKTKAKVTK